MPSFYPSPFTLFQRYVLKSFFFLTAVTGAFFFLAYPLHSISLSHNPPPQHTNTHTNTLFIFPSYAPSTSPEGWTLINVTSNQAEPRLWSRHTQKEKERDRAWVECLPHSHPHPHTHKLHPPGLSIKKHGMGGREQDDSAIKLSSSLALPMSNSTCLHRFRVTFELLCLF